MHFPIIRSHFLFHIHRILFRVSFPSSADVAANTREHAVDFLARFGAGGKLAVEVFAAGPPLAFVVVGCVGEMADSGGGAGMGG